MKNLANKIAKSITAVAATMAFAFIVPVKVLADAQCAYNICPEDTSIIYQNGALTITDVQVAGLASVLVLGILLVVNGKKIKEQLG